MRSEETTTTFLQPVASWFSSCCTCSTVPRYARHHRQRNTKQHPPTESHYHLKIIHLNNDLTSQLQRSAAVLPAFLKNVMSSCRTFKTLPRWCSWPATERAFPRTSCVRSESCKSWESTTRSEQQHGLCAPFQGAGVRPLPPQWCQSLSCYHVGYHFIAHGVHVARLRCNQRRLGNRNHSIGQQRKRRHKQSGRLISKTIYHKKLNQNATVTKTSQC